MAPEIFPAPGQQDLGGRRRDYRTGALTLAVIALSVLLGWMVGRAGWNMAFKRGQAQISTVPEEAMAATQETTFNLSVSPGAAGSSTPAKLNPPSPVSRPQSNPVPKPKLKAVEPDNGLVMYERGKVVFRMPGSAATPRSANQVASAATAVTGKGDSPVPSDQASGSAANDYLLTRVEPAYPEKARQERVQGPVVMNAFVGTDGSVRELKVISGDPQLAQAATDAVRQWRFQPHILKGKPAEFETRITVNFTLP